MEQINFYIISLLLVLISPILIYLCLYKKIDIFAPPIFFSLVIFLGHIQPLQVFLAQTDTFSKRWPFIYQDFQGSLSKALAIVIVAVISFHIGYILFMFLPRQSYKKVVTWRKERFFFLCACYTGVGLGLFGIGITLIGGVQELIIGLGDRIRAFAGLNYFFQGLFLPLIFALIWWIYLLEKKKIFNFYFIVYSVFSISISGLMGSKANTFLLVLAAIIAYHILYKPISFLTIIGIAILGLPLVGAFEIFFREYLILGQIVTLDLSQPIYVILLQLADKMLGGNFIQIQVLSIIADIEGFMPKLYGKTFLFLLIAPIPSSIWPEKLSFALPAPGIFTLAIWPERWLQTGTTLPPSLIGEFYMNFGIVGVLIGMIVFGMFYRYIYQLVLIDKKNPYNVILYSTTLATMVHYIRGEFVSPTILLSLILLPAYVGLRFLTKFEPSSKIIEKPRTRNTRLYF